MLQNMILKRYFAPFILMILIYSIVISVYTIRLKNQSERNIAVYRKIISSGLVAPRRKKTSAKIRLNDRLPHYKRQFNKKSLINRKKASRTNKLNLPLRLSDNHYNDEDLHHMFSSINLNLIHDDYTGIYESNKRRKNLDKSFITSYPENSYRTNSKEKDLLFTTPDSSLVTKPAFHQNSKNQHATKTVLKSRNSMLNKQSDKAMNTMQQNGLRKEAMDKINSVKVNERLRILQNRRTDNNNNNEHGGIVEGNDISDKIIPPAKSAKHIPQNSNEGNNNRNLDPGPDGEKEIGHVATKNQENKFLLNTLRDDSKLPIPNAGKEIIQDSSNTGDKILENRIPKTKDKVTANIVPDIKDSMGDSEVPIDNGKLAEHKMRVNAPENIVNNPKQKSKNYAFNKKTPEDKNPLADDLTLVNKPLEGINDEITENKAPSREDTPDKKILNSIEHKNIFVDIPEKVPENKSLDTAQHDDSNNRESVAKTEPSVVRQQKDENIDSHVDENVLLSLHDKKMVDNSPQKNPPNVPGKSSKPDIVIIMTESRSGSTWLMNTLSFPDNAMFFFEPLNSRVNEQFLSNRPQGESEAKALIRWRMSKLAGICTCKLSIPGVGSTSGWQKNYKPEVLKGLHMRDVENDCRSKAIKVAKPIRLYDISEIRLLPSYNCSNFKVIHLVRDPRAVMMSRMITFHELYDGNKKLGPYVKGSLDAFSDDYVAKASRDYCSHHSNSIRYSGESWLESQYLRVRYEDFARNPDAMAREMYHFIGQPFTAKVRQYVYESTHQSQGGGGYGTFKDTQKVLDSWKKKILPRHLEVIDKECKDLMDRVGYERGIAS